MACTAAGKMRSIWSSKTVPLRLKLRIYCTGVCSKLTYGCEAWKLDEQACAMLNGANSRMVSHITGKSVWEEASRYTRTIDILCRIRARRLRWVGHILRMDTRRLVHRAVKRMSEHRSPGDLLMDVPRKYSWAELKQLAANRDYWRNRVKALREGSSRVEENTRGPPPSPCKRRANRRHTTTTNPPKPTTSSPSAEAKRYKARDAHEAFFRPLTESPRKRNRHAKHKRTKCKKSRSLTDK